MTDSELKEILIDIICYECDFSEEELEFWTWLIWALGLTSS